MAEAYLIYSELLSRVKNLRHGFSLRSMPEKAFATLNQRTATVKQVHKADIEWTSGWQKGRAEADGIGTLTAGLPVGVFSADCSPILMATLDNNGNAKAVMAIHAGWRGAAAKIAEHAVESLWRKAPGEKIIAAVGPTIGFDAFEVGEAVVAAFPGSEERGLARFLRTDGARRKYLFHLAGENARQITEAAARLKMDCIVDVLDECTFQKKDRYPSFRRDRENAGRMLSFAEFTC